MPQNHDPGPAFLDRLAAEAESKLSSFNAQVRPQAFGGATFDSECLGPGFAVGLLPLLPFHDRV
jgi:hypothetical protein